MSFMEQFKPYDASNHDARIEAIRARSKRKYIDDGPVALFHMFKEMQAKGFTAMLDWALTEIERLYALEDTNGTKPSV